MRCVHLGGTIEDKGKTIDKKILRADTNPRSFQMKLQSEIDENNEVELGERFGEIEEVLYEPDCSDIEQKAKKKRP